MISKLKKNTWVLFREPNAAFEEAKAAQKAKAVNSARLGKADSALSNSVRSLERQQSIIEDLRALNQDSVEAEKSLIRLASAVVECRDRRNAVSASIFAGDKSLAH